MSIWLTDLLILKSYGNPPMSVLSSELRLFGKGQLSWVKVVTESWLKIIRVVMSECPAPLDLTIINVA